MPATYDKIATTTLGSAAATIDFNSIAASWTDLKLIVTGHQTGTGGAVMYLGFNSDTASNYSNTEIRGNGSVTASSRGTSTTNMRIGFIQDDSISSSYTSVSIADIFSYAGSTFKTVLGAGSADANGSGVVGNAVGLWRSTAAITSITIFPVTGNTWTANTTATLYGILKA